MRVLIASCRRASGGDPADVYPDPDRPLLVGALEAAGADVSSSAWDTPDEDWDRFDLVAVRSTWDSVDRPSEFLAWVRHVADVTPLVNPRAAIEWNLDKRYLRELEAAGIPVLPTTWVSSPAEWTNSPDGEFVVKPSVSGGGRRTARYFPHQVDTARAHVRRMLDDGYTAMVQDFVPNIDRDGELKLIFIDSDFSHAVRVGALLERGQAPPPRPWEKPVPIEPADPTTEQLALGTRVVAAASEAAGTPLAYARVDLIGPFLNEVELIDPILMLRFAPAGAAGRLAESLLRWGA